MKLVKLSCLFIISFLVFASCRVRVTSSVDSDYFIGKKTYAWKEEPVIASKFDRESKRKVLDIDIKKEVESAMAKNGFVYDSVNPNFIINHKALYEKDRTTNKVSKSSLTGFTGGSAVNLNTMPIPQNSLAVLVQLLDPKNQQIVWSGLAIRNTGDVMTLTKIVDEEVKKVVKKIPKKKERIKSK